ncbi:MAG: poly-gamma-glutamate system protein [Oscillospiraceae bacterium]|nr:poly-gamma-glutamate system protein [Oscillospiraceae bacterium]
MRTIDRPHLLAALALLLAALTLGTLCAPVVPAADYAEKLDAAARMQACMDRVREYKEALGLGVSADDLRGTGMIGEPYTFITTTSGALEAKRTTADPDMAALVVQLLHEAGVRAGDTVGAGFSGSFPAMNLAVLCACAAMDVRVVCIASVGASTYGANQPELTYPDMALRLAADGLIPLPDAFSMGGWRDCGLDMDPELAAQIRARLEASGVPMLYEEDFAANLAARRQLYADKGPISCFIGVGGNLSTIGQGEDTVPYGLVPPQTVKRTDAGSGLLELYNAEGLPVLHLLNIKRLVADYGLPYDPQQPTVPGESAVYHTKRFPPAAAVLGLCGALALLAHGRAKRREEDAP